MDLPQHFVDSIIWKIEGKMNGQEGNFGKLNMFCFLSIPNHFAPFAQGVDFFHIYLKVQNNVLLLQFLWKEEFGWSKYSARN